MRQISRIEFQRNLIIIRYNDDGDPKWVDEKVLVVDWKKDANIVRLTHVGYHLFDVLIENPQLAATNDEALLEWVRRLFDEHPIEGQERP